MITEFEEHSQGAAKVQFTVSRTSLPNLLEWTERLQSRFRVTIQMQWELDQEAARLDEAAHVRWVALRGEAADCQKAKEYITIFCDAPHKMNVTYPEGIHTDLKDSQMEMEESYSCVLHFLKVGQLLIRSNDEMNLSLVLSVIEEKAAQYERHKDSSNQCITEFRTKYQGRNCQEPDLSDNDLEEDSMLVEDHSPNDTPPAQMMRSRSPGCLQTPAKHLLGGDPLKLKSKDSAVIPGQLSKLFSPVAEHSSISPDRKKIKSQPHPDQASSSPTPSPNFYRKYAHGSARLGTLNLSSSQQLAIQRVRDRGNFTQSEIDRVLEKVGSNWECADLITLLRRERTQQNIPESASHPPTKLDKLKNTQASLMQCLQEQSFTEPVHQELFSESRQKRYFMPPVHSPTSSAFSDEVLYMGIKKPPRDEFLQKKELSPFPDKHNKEEEKDLVMDGKDNVKDETDSILVISESDNEIVITNSSEESDTLEEFYIKGVLQERPKKESSSLAQHGTQLKKFNRPNLPAVERQKSEEQLGVIESLKKQIADLQDKLEQDRAEASSQQQVAILLQQTQREEMERQYLLQQQQLLEQQQQLQKQFELQEQALKAQQEVALKQLQQQQQEKQEQAMGTADLPREAIIIKPASRNPASPLRPVVIDGSNVAMSHGRQQVYSCRGIALCVAYFQRRGHQDITVFVPQGRRMQKPNAPDRPMKDQPILEQLESQGLLSFTPSRRIGHNYVNCYDDRFIVELAVQNDGVIVSNDNFRDLMGESPQWRFVIENRLVMYTFAGDHFMILNDPLGRKGPRIDQILCKSQPPGNAAGATSQQRLKTLQDPKGLSTAQPATKVGMQTLQGKTVLTLPATGVVPQWGTSAKTGAQIVGAGTAKGTQRPQTAPAPAPKAILAASFGQKAGRKDAKDHPCYEMLMGIFPNNEEEVLRVLTKNSDKEDANELVIQVLVEKEKSE
ncbi:uncharacterized protein LOC110990049 [Acanthaster planci]|uniref:Uncharacterized protein LOC110990049 n=1 Tax=Acanthaster planci TaxID=133434 RepID=A0A8B8A3Q7_ACAPL|nr:uncharacterized protein LOC110990049 [Acanthaster planci]XP_022110525.1 uncharacterized protein LOC110990049 [Acanthaster planci]XP_022110526.1 uncharacterized protein LOC110990049 [Acanthaster planci]